MLTSKQRATLRGFANTIQPVTQVGKSGVTPELIKTVDNCLDSRELIKLSVLETAGLTAREAADAVSDATGADVVSVIGRKFVLYKPFKENPKIVLP
jgi:RNA-binding protein